MNDCLFCKIARKEIPANIVYEDKDIIAFLDIRPINPGHTLVVPKKHSTNIYDTDDKILEKIGPVLKKIAIAVKKATSAEGINIGMNNEGVAGQVIMHPHFHIIPRFDNDGHKHWHGIDNFSKEELIKLEEKIKQEI